MKKIAKFLDSVMGGIKRTCVAKALAVFAVASIAINANAQATNEQAVITGIDQLDGISQEDLLKNAITFTTDKNLKFPTDSKYHFFLYNVKTGRFLNAGGYWGTHASLKEYGEPIAIVNPGTFKLNGQSIQKIKLVMEMHGTEGKFVGYPGVYDQTNPDRGVYIDRKSDQVFGWVLQPVTGKGQNTYKLYTYCVNEYGNTVTTKKYYLCSNKGQVDVDRNCEAYPESALSDYAGYDEWRFISYDQIHNLQKYNGDNLTDALELSFMLKCPGFSRGDNDITSWHTYNFKTEKSDVTGFDDGFALYGLSKYYNYIAGSNTTPNEAKVDDVEPTWKNELSSTAYEFDGIKYANKDGDWDNYRRNLGKYYCASITNKRGIVYQNVDVTMPGTYKIECNGYSKTKKATLFAGVIDPGNKNKMLSGSLNTTILNQTGDMPQTVQTDLHITEKNMDYAGKSFYSGNYSNTVYVTVPEDAIVDGKATIRLGIMVGYPETDTAVEGDEWTVFDKFHILYASRTFDEDLILDEHRDNLNYLMDLRPMKNKTLRLKKDFTLNKWNSFILPVNLTKKQVIETFGASARLAKLTNLTETTGIEFTSVKLNGDNDMALEAYVPYLIFPVKGADQTKAYTAKYEQNATTKRLLVNIDDNHYVIDKVSMPLTTIEGVEANDFSKMDQEHWTTTVTGGNKDIKAYGTFARTFGSEQTDNENGTYTWEKNGNIIEGRDKLIDCYFFDKGNMYHSATRPRGLRGFSCWFKMAEGAQNALKFTLDGVSQGTTGIEDILADYEQPVCRFANGIYNLNGQLVKQGNSTAGLPSGMYIVNGKKCIVR